MLLGLCLPAGHLPVSTGWGCLLPPGSSDLAGPGLRPYPVRLGQLSLGALWPGQLWPWPSTPPVLQTLGLWCTLALTWVLLASSGHPGNSGYLGPSSHLFDLFWGPCPFVRCPKEGSFLGCSHQAGGSLELVCPEASSEPGTLLLRALCPEARPPRCGHRRRRRLLLSGSGESEFQQDGEEGHLWGFAKNVSIKTTWKKCTWHPGERGLQHFGPQDQHRKSKEPLHSREGRQPGENRPRHERHFAGIWPITLRKGGQPHSRAESRSTHQPVGIRKPSNLGWEGCGPLVWCWMESSSSHQQDRTGQRMGPSRPCPAPRRFSGTEG